MDTGNKNHIVKEEIFEVIKESARNLFTARNLQVRAREGNIACIKYK